jgi:hypothetical protein
LATIRNSTAIKAKDVDCNSCPAVSIIAIAHGDTSRLTQKGEVSIEIKKLINKLQEFVLENKHNTIKSVGFWQTENAIMPIPPTKIGDTTFKPQVVTKKSGS